MQEHQEGAGAGSMGTGHLDAAGTELVVQPRCSGVAKSSAGQRVVPIRGKLVGLVLASDDNFAEDEVTHIVALGADASVVK